MGRLVEGLKQEDPPATPQLAIPVAVPEQVLSMAMKQEKNKAKAVGDLALIAFYYLLRMGEYTQPKFVTVEGKKVRATRTVQFTIENIGFFKDNKILPRGSPLKKLLTADSCTLKITNQKNGQMGETIHQNKIHLVFCPVKGLARRVNHILSHDGTTTNLLCDIWDESNESWTSIKSLKLEKRGIAPNLVGCTHCAQGALWQ